MVEDLNLVNNVLMETDVAKPIRGFQMVIAIRVHNDSKKTVHQKPI